MLQGAGRPFMGAATIYITLLIVLSNGLLFAYSTFSKCFIWFTKHKRNSYGDNKTVMVTKELMVAIDFHSTFFHIIKVNGSRQLCDL